MPMTNEADSDADDQARPAGGWALRRRGSRSSGPARSRRQSRRRCRRPRRRRAQSVHRRSPSQPTATKMLQVMMSVAIVMPEIGLDELPMSPVMRDDTVTKKKPKITIRTAATKFHCIGMPGVTARNSASSSDPTSTTDQRHVVFRSEPAARACRRRRSPSRSRGTTRRSSGSFARA